MSLPSDPIRTWRRRLGAICLASLSAATLCMNWALRDLDTYVSIGADASEERPESTDKSDVAPPARSLLDETVFAVQLWREPPSPIPEIATPEPPQVQPPALQLVAIIRDADQAQAVFYDPRIEQLLYGHAGQQIGPCRIIDVGADTVELEFNGRTMWFCLREEA